MCRQVRQARRARRRIAANIAKLSELPRD